MAKTRLAGEDLAFELANFLPYKLSALSRLTQKLLASTLSQSGLTVAQWRVYLCLASKGPMHLNGIADFTHLPQSSLSRSIAQMDERGLVRNARDKSDRRISRIELTPEGRRRVAELTAAMDAACQSAFQMNPTEEAGFLKTLDALIGRLSNQLEQPK